MKKFFLLILPGALMFSCKGKTDEKKLEVSGVINNNPAGMIYLEELPMTTMERIVVDSVKLSKDGTFRLQAETGEARVYNLRLDQNIYPFATLINDAGKIVVNASFSKENSQFPDSYEVKNSAASLEMKEYISTFNSNLQSIVASAQQADSIQKASGADSLLAVLKSRSEQLAEETRTLTFQTLKKGSNPALSMFVLGYYQSTSNYPGSLLKGFSEAEVKQFVEETALRFPQHQGVISIKSTLNAAPKGWVGQQAPEISLPDPSGNEIRLSSFKGKYVLVDFWASWCRPCREENPNVVQAYQQFKNRNFTILGVSLDRPGQKEQWVNAIMQDKLTWTHISDLQFWNSPVVPLYKIEGIPYNVLIDPQGKIIAESLRGEQLLRKLEEVLP